MARSESSPINPATKKAMWKSESVRLSTAPPRTGPSTTPAFSAEL